VLEHNDVMNPAHTPEALELIVWADRLAELERMVRAATESGLRHRTPRGRWCWGVIRTPGKPDVLEVYPIEYLRLTQLFAYAPESVRRAVREITQ
jgi:hypothetical protein